MTILIGTSEAKSEKDDIVMAESDQKVPFVINRMGLFGL